MVKVVSYNCNSVRNNAEIVKKLLDIGDIVCLQEIMLHKRDLDILNDFNKEFRHVAYVKEIDDDNIKEGRPSGGVAIFWKKHLSPYIVPIYIDERILGIIFKMGDSNLLILNVYLPCDFQNINSLDEYRNSLAVIESVVHNQRVNDLIIVGDFNADPRKGRFWKELSFLLDSLSLTVLDSSLPEDTFTYLCPARNITSWLDHVLASVNISSNIDNIVVDYECAIYDHFPILFDLIIPHIVCDSPNEPLLQKEFVKWHKMNKADYMIMQSKMDDYINDRNLLESSSLLCMNTNCKEIGHKKDIDILFESIKLMFQNSTSDYLCEGRKKYKIIPGWNDYVKEFHKLARENFLIWKNNGKPTDGFLCEEMKRTRALFKNALKICKDEENKIRGEKLLNNMKTKNYTGFWKEIHSLNRHNYVDQQMIDGSSDKKEICEMFSDRYKAILHRNKEVISNMNSNVQYNNRIFSWVILTFSTDDIINSIRKINHSVGFDNIHSNHLKHCSKLSAELISRMFYSFLIHNHVPLNLIRGVIVPTLKDKLGDVSSADNYRPVMISSVFLKLFELCLLNKIEPFLKLNDSQHGFRKKYSTSTACFILKETIHGYLKAESNVHACFIDVSKAFDSVNHDILLTKLSNLGIPNRIVEVIGNWYSNQYVKVKYANCFSNEWKINNGVRQGGILSGIFFNIYIDSLLEYISKMKFGCRLGNFSSNVIAYADDIVLLAPSLKALKMLFDEASRRISCLDLKINFHKSKYIVFRNKNEAFKLFPFSVNDTKIDQVKSIKYLGYIINDNLYNDIDDIRRVSYKFYAEFNTILRKFSFTDKKVKLFLFKQYCLQMYGCELWLGNFSQALRHFEIGYHKAIKKILGLSYHESNHYACQEGNLYTFKHLFNKLRISCMIRFLKFPCDYVKKIIDYMYVSSFLLSDTYKIINDMYQMDSLMENDFEAIIARIAYVQNHENQSREPVNLVLN